MLDKRIIRGAMRWIVAMMLAAGLELCGARGMAQSTAGNTAVVDGFPLPLDPSPPADTGKPHLFVPQPAAPPAAGCAAAFDCRVRVIGTIEHNGAVELNTSILKW